MIGDFYNKMKSKLLAALKDVKPKVVSKSINENKNTAVESTIESNSESKNDGNVVKEPISITIHRPIYEYSHGKRFKNKPTWIVIHYTACANISAKSMCKAMKNNECASSHFYIDENDIYQSVPLDYIAWHISDGKCKQPSSYDKKSLEELSKYIAKDWRYDLAATNHLKWIEEGNDFKGNSVSLSVDLCVKKRSTKTLKATDQDWYFEKNTIDNAAKLVAYLAKEYNIDLGHIIRHGDATGKLCPTVWISKYIGDGCDDAWKSFLDRVSEYMNHEIVAKFI